MANDPHQCIPWIYSLFGECATTQRQVCAILIGVISLCCWLVSQTPYTTIKNSFHFIDRQLIKNAKRRKVEGLSVTFLVCWLLGDIASLVGALLSNQMILLILQSIYFVLVDLVLMGQYWYYGRREKLSRQWIHHRPSWLEAPPVTEIKQVEGADATVEDSDTVETAVVEPVSVSSCSSATTLLAVTFCFLWSSSSLNVVMHSISTGSQLLVAEPFQPHPHDDESSECIGLWFGWLSAIFYLIARLPQIIDNHRRSSTKGLATLMFGFTFVANVTFGLQIILFSTEWDYLMPRMPWIVGAIGTLILDMVVLVQIVLYRKNKIAPIKSQRK